MRFLYNISIALYGAGARTMALFNPKARKWVCGRKDILSKISMDFAHEKSPVIWFHSASLGEFEQGRPLIEKLKKEQPKYKILVTFFSPSGYEIRKNYPLADYIYYLPEDTPNNARQFLQLVQPKMAVFIKYEYWYNYLNQIFSQRIPLIFISSIFRPDQIFFKKYGGWFKNHLLNTSHFFVQNEESVSLLKKTGIEQVSLTGDTRFDRVAAIARSVNKNEIVQSFKSGKKLFLGGSTWPDDELLIAKLAHKNRDLKILIAPHLIDQKHIEQIEQLFPGSVRYSNASSVQLCEIQTLIIDNMGMLSSLYQYADFAMIGGGFGVGIHNTLEAATFGMPIFIGPNYQKFQEAHDLIAEGVIQVVVSEDDLAAGISMFLNNEEDRQNISQVSRNYVTSKTGATQLIFDFILQQLNKSK